MLRQKLYKLLLIFVLVGFPLYATAGDTYDEYDLKAAITYNLAKFVKWPDGVFADKKTPLIICVIGNGAVASGFVALEGELLGGRPISIQHLRSVNDFKNGQVLFIARSKSQRLAETLLLLQGKPVLTISDMKNFATNGGMINLVKNGGHIRFAINLDASMAANLQVSSKLHSLATEVIRRGQ